MTLGPASAQPRTPIPIRDQTWVRMDRPNNLMYIQSLMWFDRAPDWDEVTEVILSRAVQRFPVLRSRAVQVRGDWFWEVDAQFDMARHVRRSELPPDATAADLRAHISSRFGSPLKWDRPLWSLEYVSGVPDLRDGPAPTDGPAPAPDPVSTDDPAPTDDPVAADAAPRTGGLIFWRFHHAIADGIRSTQLLLSMCDVEGEASVPAVGDRPTPEGPLEVAELVGRHLADGAVDAGRSAVSTVRHLGSRLGRAADGLFERPFGLSRLPVRTVEAVASLVGEDNTVVNTWRSVSRLLLEPRTPELGWSGTPTTHKEVGWITDVDLDRIKRIAHALDGTVNDVVLTAVSMALTTYLYEQGEIPPDALNWMVPVSLQAIDMSLPKELGNHFSLVLFRMPLGHNDPRDALDAVREMMNRTKHSLEPHLGYLVLQSLPLVPEAVSAPVVNLFANKSVGQITNVPGPQNRISLAGTPVAGILGWVPLSGDQPIGVCIFSYCGAVSFGVVGDAGLVKDPQRIAELVAAAITDLDVAAGTVG